MSRASLGVLGCTRPIRGRFWGYFGSFIWRFVSQVSPYCSRILAGLWGVRCSLWRQAGTDRAQGFKDGATGGTEGCLSPVRGIRAVPGQFAGIFGVFFFFRLFTLQFVSQISPYCSRILGDLWGVWCSVWRQGGTNGGRQKFSGSGVLGGTEGCKVQVGRVWAVLGQCRVLVRVVFLLIYLAVGIPSFSFVL